jgi:general secretion pathway protein J
MNGGCVRQAAHPADHERGFTLLELLVSLALLALILSFVGGALRFGARAWEAAGALDRGASMAAVRTFLEQRMAEATPVYERDEAGRVRIAFSGLSQELSFVSPFTRGEAGAGLYRFHLYLQSVVPGAQDGMALVLRQSLYQPDVVRPVAGTSAEGQFLLRDIAGIGFRYFGQMDPRTPAAWQSEWTRTDALPELIEMSVLLRDLDARAWLPLVVELKLRTAP